jgi:hypothetical protein
VRSAAGTRPRVPGPVLSNVLRKGGREEDLTSRDRVPPVRAGLARQAAVVAVFASVVGVAGCAHSPVAKTTSKTASLRCTQATCELRRLPHISPRMIALPAKPFGVAATKGFSFVTLGGFLSTAALGVFDDRRGVPRLLRRMPLPLSFAGGERLTPRRPSFAEANQTPLQRWSWCQVLQPSRSGSSATAATGSSPSTCERAITGQPDRGGVSTYSHC